MKDARTTRIALEKYIYTREPLVNVMERMSSLTSAPKHVAQGDQDSIPNKLCRESCQWSSCIQPRRVLDYCCCYGDQNCEDVLEVCGLFGKEAMAFGQN